MNCNREQQPQMIQTHETDNMNKIMTTLTTFTITLTKFNPTTITAPQFRVKPQVQSTHSLTSASFLTDVRFW